jgi:hypothetical protein
VHRCCFGETNRATHETLKPGAQIDVLAFDLLRMRFAKGAFPFSRSTDEKARMPKLKTPGS